MEKKRESEKGQSRQEERRMVSEKPERCWISKDKYKGKKDGMDGTRKVIRERTVRPMDKDKGIYGKVIKERGEKEVLVMENWVQWNMERERKKSSQK